MNNEARYLQLRLDFRISFIYNTFTSKIELVH